MSNVAVIQEDQLEAEIEEGAENLQSDGLPAYSLMTREELLRVIAVRDRQVGELASAIAVLQSEKNNLGTLAHELLNSYSWKVTAPLRKLMKLKRALFPLLRFRTRLLRPTKVHNVAQQGTSFRVVGPTPYIELDSPSMPQGWVQVSADLKTKRGQLFFALYYRTGEGFSGADRVWLSLSDNNRSSIILKLPRGVRGLRLDPFDLEEEFALASVNFRELGSLNLFWHLCRGHLLSVIKNPKSAIHLLKRAALLARRGLIPALKNKLIAAVNFHDYPFWVKTYDDFRPADFTKMEQAVATLNRTPTISLIMPTYNSPEKYLRLAIDSVRAQVYPHWELCIADDASTHTSVRKVLEEYTRKDSRIKVVFRPENGHISEASNSAIELATGEYIAFLDHDDELTPDALLVVANAINTKPGAKFIYSDEDKKTAEGERFNPYFKSGWNPELLLSQNYVCHLTVYAADVVRAVGGLRQGFEGAQDWDLALRVVDSINEEEIVHIPHILYHWRVIEGSTAQSTSFKPYVLQAQKKAVEEHLQRKEEQATVKIQPEIAQLRVKFAIPSTKPRVSLVIPTRDMVRLLAQCVDSILQKTRYREFDIVIVDNGSKEQETLRYFEKLSQLANVKIIRDDSPFNFSRLNNLAITQVDTPLVGLINNDLEVISPDWLEEMVSHAVRTKVGAVGARLLYPNGLLQHGGVVLGIGGVAGHSHKGRPGHDVGYFNRIILPGCFSAVTAACLVMRKEIYDEVGGLDEVNFQVAFNDVDFCLRIREKGYRIVYNPYAELYHHESASRGYETTSPEKFARFEGEVERMKKRWGHLLKNDPYYNPNLTLLTEDFAFSYPPRRDRFWRA